MSEEITITEEWTEEVAQAKIANANTTLVLSILSVIGCVCYGFPGIVLATTALLLHRNIKKVYETDPEKFQLSYNNAKAGFLIAVISLILSVATTIYTVWVLYVLWYVEALVR